MTTTTIDTAILRELAERAKEINQHLGPTDLRDHEWREYISLATVFVLLDRSDRLDAIREAVDKGRWDEVARLSREGE